MSSSCAGNRAESCGSPLAMLTVVADNDIMGTYDLHSLGWHNFQQLCLTISREVLGQTVQAFLNSRDGGRDGAFAGEWKPRAGEDLKGRYVIQCKFTSKVDKPLKLSDLKDELAKAKRLVQRGRCDCYLLLTNLPISGVEDEKIDEAFLAVGVKQFRCFGADWICQQIRESGRLRMLVPRVYGLGDLSEILDERAYTQAQVLLASMREDLSRVVLTGAYDRAITALDDHGFVLLLGEPACGKTTTAAMLAMAAIDQWKVSTLKLEKSEQMIERWNPNNPFQFFWIDDAFGVTQYEQPLVLDWNRIFPKVKAMLSAGARVVLTSRDYIYKRAKQNLKESAFPLMRESQVVIDVRDISQQERREILYNHIKLGVQPAAFRREIKPLLEGVASHSRFTPETARRLGNPLFTRALHISQESLDDFVERQEQLLQEVIQGLDEHSRASLALIFMRNGVLEIPVRLKESETSALARLGSNLGEMIAALGALQDSLTVHVTEDGRALWTFKHPTVGDAYGSILLTNPDLMDVYVEGAPCEKLIATITCGNVGLKGAVVIPKGLYDPVMAKVSGYLESAHGQFGLRPWEIQSKVYRFLAGRCDRAFLESYLKHYPELLERITDPGLYLSAVPEVQLTLKLFELGLLPEQYRRKFVQAVIQYTVAGQDGYVLKSEEMRKMFTPAENDELTSRLRAELVPNLSTARRNWQQNHESDDDPESYMEPFVELLSALETEFTGDDNIKAAIDNELEQARSWIEAARDEYYDQEPPEHPEPDYDVGDYSHTGGHELERSIFEDIDQ
jgi:hypothetical protein